MSQHELLLLCFQALLRLHSSLLPIRSCYTVCSCHTLRLQHSKLVH
jgi:hypothetical protein